MKLLGTLICALVGHRERRTRAMVSLPGVTIHLVGCERCGEKLRPDIDEADYTTLYWGVRPGDAAPKARAGIRVPAMEPFPELRTFNLACSYESALRKVLADASLPDTERVDPKHAGVALDRALNRLNLKIVEKERTWATTPKH